MLLDHDKTQIIYEITSGKADNITQLKKFLQNYIKVYVNSSTIY